VRSALRLAYLVVIASLSTLAAVAADELVLKAPAAPPVAAGPRTLTGDWFGQGPTMRDAGLDFRLEWSQFYQGLTRGDGDKRWQYGGKWDAQLRVDLSKLGFWNGLSVTAQGVANYGESVNAIALGGSLLAVNSALFFPGIKGADASDLMALYVTQNFGNLVSLRVGKINMIELARYTPLKGGGGVDTFWNVEFAAPISGLVPPTLNGAMLSINTQPVSYGLTVFDPQDATNKPLFSNLFENGVSVMGSATLRTTAIAGLTGYYGIKGIYSTREGRDFSELIPPPGTAPVTKKGSWYVSLSVQQYLIQDPNNPARGWGVFGEIAKADANPNYHNWSVYFGVGGSSFVAGRPDDRFGVAYFDFGFSNVLKGEVAPAFMLRDQSGVEAFYNVAVTPWFRLSANVQFIRPGAGRFPDAIYAGLSSYVRF
jgi:porin